MPIIAPSAHQAAPTGHGTPPDRGLPGTGYPIPRVPDDPKKATAFKFRLATEFALGAGAFGIAGGVVSAILGSTYRPQPPNVPYGPMLPIAVRLGLVLGTLGAAIGAWAGWKDASNLLDDK